MASLLSKDVLRKLGSFPVYAGGGLRVRSQYKAEGFHLDGTVSWPPITMIAVLLLTLHLALVHGASIAEELATAGNTPLTSLL